MDATDKYAGAVVGLRAGTAAHDSAGAAHAAAGVDELLQTESGALLASFLDVLDGSLRRVPVADPGKAIARVVQMGQMASMLRDRFRCEQYAKGIEAAIAEFRRVQGRPPRVLDIGAGTGLLSMLAARGGAATVVGVEQWAPMCSIATKVLEHNAPGLPLAPVLMPVHSSALTLGEVPPPPPGVAVGAPFDLVVSEIVDSGLLGEGMAPALTHAFTELCGAGRSEGAAAVPRAATVWAQLVSAPIAELWHCTDGLDARRGGQGQAEQQGDGGGGSCPAAPLGRSDWADRCSAPSPAIPVHLGAVWGLRAASAPFAALACDFTPEGLVRGPAFAPPPGAPSASEAVADHFVYRVPASATDAAAASTCNAVAFWWDLELAPGVHYSTAPEASATQGWQDHWVQCLQPLPRPVSPGADGSFAVAVTCPGSTRVSFAVAPGGAAVWPSRLKHRQAVRAGRAPADPPEGVAPPPFYLEPPPCTCGVHATAAPDRRWMLRAEGEWLSSLRAGIDAALARATALAGREARRALTVVALGDSAACAVLAASSPALRDFAAGEGEGAGRAVLVAVESSVQGAVHAERVLGEACSGGGGGADGEEDTVLQIEHSVCNWDVASPIAATVSEALCDTQDPPPASPPPVDVLLIEPFFAQTAQRPLWGLYTAWARCRALAPLLSEGAVVLPARATIFAQAVRFRELHRTHAPAGAPCGLDHAPFDAVQAGFSAQAFAYPLWQYAHELVGAPAPVFAAEFSLQRQPLQPPGGRARVPRAVAGNAANAVVLYVAYEWQQGLPTSAAGESCSGVPSLGQTWCPGGPPSPWRQDVIFLEPRLWQGEPGDASGEAAACEWLDVDVGFAEGQPKVAVTPIEARAPAGSFKLA